MPATLVLNGVRSPRTYASSVTCSTFPPSQPFQLRVMVMKTARASATTRRGVTYFFHSTLLREAAAGLSLSGGRGFVTGAADSAGTGEVDIKFAPWKKSVLTLCQGKLRCKLDIDHRADAAVELKEGRCFLSGQDSSKDRHIALTQFCLFDVRVQPAANKIVGLVIGQGSVFVRIFFDNRRSRVVDLSHFRRVFFVHLPELFRFAIRERQILSNELLLDRAYIPA